MNTSILKKMLPWLLCGAVIFYGIPALSIAVGSDWGFLAILLALMVINPLYCFGSSLCFTAKNGFRWYYPVLLGLLFAPSVMIYYNSSAAFYCLMYLICAFAGGGAWLLVRFLVEKNAQKKA